MDGHTYKVYHKLSGSSDWSDTADLGNVATYTQTGLAANTAYDFSMTAHKDNSISAKHYQITETTLMTVPTAPTGL